MLDQKTTTEAFNHAMSTAFHSIYYSEPEGCDSYRATFMHELQPEQMLLDEVTAMAQSSFHLRVSEIAQSLAENKIGIYNFRFFPPLQDLVLAEDTEAYIQCLKTVLNTHVQSALVACERGTLNPLLRNFMKRIQDTAENVVISGRQNAPGKVMRFDLAKNSHVCMLFICELNATPSVTI